MKRLVSFLSATVLSIGLSAGMAAADTVTCSGSITNTGPNSNNTVNCVGHNEVSVSCVNNIVTDLNNDQSASSGGAFTTNNTTGGSSTSGGASNSSTVQVTEGASCAPVQTAAASTSTPAGGQGGGAPATPTPTPAAAAKPATQPAALPETGSNTALNDTLAGVAVLGGLMAVSRVGMLAYRRQSLK